MRTYLTCYILKLNVIVVLAYSTRSTGLFTHNIILMTNRCNEQLISEPCSSCITGTLAWWPAAANLPPGSPGKPLLLTLVLCIGLVDNFMQTWNLACLSFCDCLITLHEMPSWLLCYVSDGRIRFEKPDYRSVYTACVHTPRSIHSSVMNGYEDHLHVMATENGTATSIDHLSLSLLDFDFN